MMKTIGKKKIIEMLKEGATIRFYNLMVKIYINVNGENVYAVRYNTYVDLFFDRSIQLIKTACAFDYEEYGLKEGK